MKDKITAKLAIMPLIIVIMVFAIFPVYKLIDYSLFNMKIYSDSRVFVGIQNYIVVLKDPLFWLSLKNSLIFTLGSIFVQVVLGIIIAVFLNEAFYGRNIFRGLMLFSYVIPLSVTAVVWKFMFNDFTGVINYTIDILHLPIPKYWFSNPRTAMIGVIVVAVWKYFPFMVLMFLAQIQGIDKEQYEAASIDGANRAKEFFYITLPSLKPVIFIAVLLRTIFTIKDLSLVHLITGGGPINSTTVLPIFIYNKTLKEFSLGMGSATSVLMLIIILILSFIYLRFYDISQKQLTG